ncbi:hypothetical protein OEZ86_001430 [Tetradesmus obliquus]|nr:hypothetical protein OEZ86_001430 [Tetradesmus obliquus]
MSCWAPLLLAGLPGLPQGNPSIDDFLASDGCNEPTQDAASMDIDQAEHFAQQLSVIPMPWGAHDAQLLPQGQQQQQDQQPQSGLAGDAGVYGADVGLHSVFPGHPGAVDCDQFLASATDSIHPAFCRTLATKAPCLAAFWLA